MRVERAVASALLNTESVVFRVGDPVTFSSGIKSPIYIDSRNLIAHPTWWRGVIEGFVSLIYASGMEYDVIAGVAVGGVSHCAALSYQLQKPCVFVRKDVKEHGLGKMVEGADVDGRHVLLLEDSVTTGGSSMSAVRKLRDAGAQVTDVVSVISYGFSLATELFAQSNLRLHTLTDFDTLLNMATERKFISLEDFNTVDNWIKGRQ